MLAHSLLDARYLCPLSSNQNSVCIRGHYRLREGQCSAHRHFNSLRLQLSCAMAHCDSQHDPGKWQKKRAAPNTWRLNDSEAQERLKGNYRNHANECR